MGEINYFKKTEKALYDYKYLKGYIELRKKDIEELEYIGVSASRLSNTKSSNRQITDPVYEELKTMINTRDFLKNEIEQKQKLINRIEYAVSLLDNNIEKSIVKKKYFEGKRFKVIAIELKYSEIQIKRKKREVINKISLILWGK